MAHAVILRSCCGDELMAAPIATVAELSERKGGQDVGFAIGIVFILTVLFLPLPAVADRRRAWPSRSRWPC